MNTYLFDVDGVLTNPKSSESINPEIIQVLIDIMKQGTLLGFISGRGMLWLRSNLVKTLENYLSDHPSLKKNMLDNVFVSGEFGGVTCIHEDGVRQEFVTKNLIIPDDVKRGLHLVAFQYSDYVFVETEKQTVYTIRENFGIKDEEFQSRRNTIMEELQNVISPYSELEVQSDRLAFNIRYKKANKQYATDTFLEWKKGKKITTDKFFVFGDSPTDLEMGEELQRQHLPFEFVYVGEASDLKGYSNAFSITVTRGHCDEGTLEYLKAHQNSS